MESHIRKLLVDAQKGDDDAFAQLYLNYRNSVFRKAQSLVHNDAEAEDITQETFIIVRNKLYQLRDLDLFYSWLLRITVNRCHRRFRKQTHMIQSDIDMIDHIKEERVYLDPVKHTQNKSEHDLLMGFIQSLPEDKAEVIKLAYFEGLKMDEIAAHLNVNVNTIKSRMRKAKELLRVEVENYEKKEHAKLQFHVDTVVPASLCLLGTNHSIVSSIMKKVTHVFDYMKANVGMSVCSLSLSVLAVSGTTFYYQDQQSSYAPPLATSNITSDKEQETKSMEPSYPDADREEQQIVFSPTQFAEKSLSTPREAYYTCINYAQDDVTMKEKTPEEVAMILPVYQALKESNSPYYQSLVDQGWVSLFEKYKQ